MSKMKKILVMLGIFVGVGVVCFVWVLVDNGDIENYEYVSFSRCVDGDTAWFRLNSKEVKVRFLGVDTP